MIPFFTQFCEAELASGGPDPQVRLVAESCRGLDWNEAAWRACAFVAPYTCGAGAAIWGSWPLERVRICGAGPLTFWLKEHWEGLPIRRERRAVWKAEKLAECLVSCARWVDMDLPGDRFLEYDDLYQSVQDGAKFFGRYAGMKLLEVLFLAGVTHAGQTDIRPHGAKFPRKFLGMLFDFPHDYSSNSADAISEANYLAAQAKEYQPRDVTWFQHETLLCNARQAMSGKYPGRSHDRELAHFMKAQEHWGPHLNTWLDFSVLRAKLFPVQYLGEYGDPPWYGARKELEQERQW